jgi:glycosyltransferase involved in cell wall biosynthesis
MKILITAPSLAEEENVSGISTVGRQIIKHSEEEFSHFVAGRRDSEKIRLSWIFKQTFLLPLFLLKIRQEKPDILHLNTALTPLAIVRDVLLAKTARVMKVPVLLHIHGGKFFTQGFSSDFSKRLTEKMLRLSSVIVVLSKIEKDFFESRWKNLNIQVLQNAVSLDEVKEKKRINKEKTIIFLGRLHEGKGLKEIVEACQILKGENLRFRFKCFGVGQEKDSFVRQMTEVLGDNFYYGGIVSGREKWQVLAESDIFLLPSHYEGLPMALLEAMASGCVPIVSDVGSIGKVIEDGKNGFLIKPRGVSQIIERLKYLLSSKADWESLRQNSKKTIKKNFDLKDYINKLEHIYREIV